MISASEASSGARHLGSEFEGALLLRDSEGGLANHKCNSFITEYQIDTFVMP